MKFKEIVINEPQELLDIYEEFMIYWKDAFDNINELGRFLFDKCKEDINKEFYQIKDFSDFKCLEEEREVFFEEFPELYRKLIKKYILHSKQLFKVYRYLGIDNLDYFLVNLKNLGLGVHWTLDLDFAYIYGLERKYGKTSLIFTALVEKEDVDWKQTIVQNTLLWLGEKEMEITLRKGSEIQIISILEVREDGIDKEININKCFGKSSIKLIVNISNLTFQLKSGRFFSRVYRINIF